MSTLSAKNVIADFLRQSDCEVLAITGSWGVGKTYLWRKILKEVGSAAQPHNYAYVSLFGISSIEQARTAILLKSEPIFASSGGAGWIDRRRRNAKSDAAKAGNQFAKHAVGHALGKTVSVALESLASHLVKNTIVCIDDFERATSVTVDGVLGLVSELKEERSCKVVLIFNADEIANRGDMRDAYAACKEKAIDVEVAYAPTIDEAFAVAFPDEFPFKAQVLARVRDLDVTNIRILRKTRRALSLVLPAVEGRRKIVVERAVLATVLMCWCAYDGDPAKLGRRCGRYGAQQ